MAENFYADTSATGANDGTSWTDAWTDMSTAISGMASGTMTDSRTLHMRGDFSEADRYDITGYAGNSASNFIKFVGDGSWDTVRGNEPALWECTSASAEAVLMREDHVTFENFRVLQSGDSSPKGIRLFTSLHDEFLAQYMYLDQMPEHEAHDNATVNFKDSVIDNDTGTNPDWLIATGTTGNEPTTNIYNCVVNNTRIRLENYNTLNIINSVMASTTTLFDRGTGTTIDGSFSAFYDNVTLDTSTSTLNNQGTTIASWFDNEASGDWTLNSTGRTALDGNGAGPTNGTYGSNVLATAFNGNSRSGTTCTIGIDEEAAAGGTHPVSPFGHPFRGAFGGPIA